MGDILVSQGKLSASDVNRIVDHQREKGLYFGEAAIELDLVKEDDILRALSSQFGYSYGHDEPSSKDMVMASAPFGDVAEEFRSIRARLLSEWLSPSQKTLAIISPGANEGRSYFAANIALAFSQLGRSTLLIDADLRSPRQHEIFAVASRVGLSTLLAGRVRLDELDMLPDKITAFPYLSVLGSGPVPPNPSELLGSDRFSLILRKLEKYFDVIVIDSPSAVYQADTTSIASVAGSALLVVRRGCSRIEDAKSLMTVVGKAKAKVVGAVLNQF
jgi:chain length determinant protein tyrosine kinase EpsG